MSAADRRRRRTLDGGVDGGAAFGVGRRHADGLQHLELQHVARIDRVRIADQRFDLRDADALQARVRGRLGFGSARARRARLGCIERAAQASASSARFEFAPAPFASVSSRHSQRDASVGEPSRRNARVSTTFGALASCAKSCAARPRRASSEASPSSRAWRATGTDLRRRARATRLRSTRRGSSDRVAASALRTDPRWRRADRRRAAGDVSRSCINRISARGAAYGDIAPSSPPCVMASRRSSPQVPPSASRQSVEGGERFGGLR